MEYFATTLVFGLCMLGMSVGVLFSNRRLRGSCGGDTVLGLEGDEMSCGACPRNEADVCPTDNKLVELAQIGHPNPERHPH
jgi:hypothetical protein